ncbi:hypothetical protein RoseRS_0732 [Roseiflexus sp. RS-1]|nr:hypothetical protein RoseRS_0732 [Roseiflexus sp. RS-1]
MDQSYRRAEALPHIVQALRAAIVIGGDRRAEALPHIVQALRVAIVIGGDRRAEALPHIVQALRVAIVIGGDRRAEALPHIVQALRAGSTRRPFGRWTVMDAIAPQGLSCPQKGLQPALIARTNRGAGVTQGSTAKSVGGRRDRRAEALPHIVQALRAGSTRRPFGRWTVMDAIAPQGLSRPQKGLQPALIARTNRGAGVTQGSTAKSVGGRRDRRAEALPHIVQALRAGSTRRPFGRWTVMDAIAPQGLSCPQRGLQPALIARTNRGAGVTQGSTAKSVGGRRDRRAEALPHIVQALRAGSTRRPFGRWTVMDAIAPQGLSRPQKGLQPALIAHRPHESRRGRHAGIDGKIGRRAS